MQNETPKLTKAQVVEAKTAKPAPTIGVAFTRPQLERVAFQVNAGLAFKTPDERQQAIDEKFIYQNDLDGIDFRWHPEFVATCTDENLAKFLLASVSSNEMISEKNIVEQMTKH